MSAASSNAGGASVDATATRTATSRPSSAAKESSVGRVVAGCERTVQSVFFQQPSHRRSLVRGDGRQNLEDLAAVTRDEPLHPCRLRDRVELPNRFALVRAAAEVEGHREPFHLDLGLRPRRVGRELRERATPALGLRLELEPVRADADHALHSDPRAHVLSRPSAHDRNERISPDEPLEVGAHLRGGSRVVGSRDDRREDAVEVEKQASLAGLGGEPLEQRIRGHAQGYAGPAIIQACRISTSSGFPS